MLYNTLLPIHSITTGLRGLGDIQSYCPAPGSCDGECVPFCCFNGGEIPVFADTTSGGEFAFQIVEGVGLAVVSLTVPGGIIATGVYYLLKATTNWLNEAMNKKRLEAEQIEITEESMRAVAYGIQAALECRLPWCERIAEMQTWSVFAPNSIIFSPYGPEAGPEAGVKCIGAYVGMAEILHKHRQGKTKQQILNAAPSTPGNIPERQLYDGKLVLRIPNIEHYWMGDKVIVNGDTSKIFTVAHRWGISPKYTFDCDSHFVDLRIAPDGFWKEKRGCKISFNRNYEGSAQSGGGMKQGYNLRSMFGEGLLVMKENYQDSHRSFIGKTVDLYRKVYTIPTTGGSPGDDKPENPFTKLIPLSKAQVASFFSDKNLIKQALMVALLAGVGVYFLNEGLKPQKQ